MASGLAVVAYDYAAARAHITDADTGALVRYGAGRVFAARAATLACQPEALAVMGRRARAAVLPLDWSRIVARFESLLDGARATADHPAVALEGAER
jgi:glycosyltransferase involved in cell wall biosynthesis